MTASLGEELTIFFYPLFVNVCVRAGTHCLEAKFYQLCLQASFESDSPPTSYQYSKTEIKGL